MKVLKRLFSSIILVFILFSASFSQEKAGDFSNQIVFIDQFQYYEEKTGIKRIVKAYKQLDISGCSPANSSEISKIANELKNTDLTTEAPLEKELLLKKLLGEQYQEWKEDYKRREKILVEPISKEIADLIKEIETRNSLKIIFADEVSGFGSLLFYDEKLDITQDFIDSYNDPKKDFGNVGLNVPQSKIALINTEKFYDQNTGLKQVLLEFIKIESIANKSNETLTESEKIRRKDYSRFLSGIGTEIEQFSKSKGFNITFDSSRKLPEKLVNIDSQDITEEFIQYYNNKYP